MRKVFVPGVPKGKGEMILIQSIKRKITHEAVGNRPACGAVIKRAQTVLSAGGGTCRHCLKKRVKGGAERKEENERTKADRNCG